MGPDNDDQDVQEVLDELRGELTTKECIYLQNYEIEGLIMVHSSDDEQVREEAKEFMYSKQNRSCLEMYNI